MSAVLLSLPPLPTGDDLRRHAVGAGFAVLDHALGAAPAVEFGPVAVAVVVVGESPEPAAAQTRRWRAELGDRVLPILWIANADQVAPGLDAGADVVLARPVAPAVFAAQLRALARGQTVASRLAARANEARLLGDQLRKALAQLDRDQELARRARAALAPKTFPEVGAVRFYACHRSRGGGTDFYDVLRIDEHHVRFVVGDAPGLLGMFAQQAIPTKEIGELSYRVLLPGEALTAANRSLLSLDADDLPLVSMLAGVVNARTGAVSLARAGSPAPVYVPATGDASVWSVPGPFLGTPGASYDTLSGTLASGDRLLIGTDGTRPDGAPGPLPPGHLLEAATAHRERRGAEFADAVARELLSRVRHADDFTLLCVEMK